MNDETRRWLLPLLAEAGKRGLTDMTPLFRQASIPAAELTDDTPIIERRVELNRLAPGAMPLAVDMVRFGQLLRDALGWDDYPGVPYPYDDRVPAYCPHCARPIDVDDGGAGFDYCPGCFAAYCCACGAELVAGEPQHAH